MTDPHTRERELVENTVIAMNPLTGLSTNILAGRYEIIRELGEGGMGRVYLCRHIALGKKFAVKVLDPELSSSPAFADRFLQEARATSKIEHRNVVSISDFGLTNAGEAFFVMEHLRGETLADLLDRNAGQLEWREATALAIQICRGLAAAHDRGIVHRDIKPENVFCVVDEVGKRTVKLLDFGIAHVVGVQKGNRRLTRTGQIIGTPEYMSPEQARGEAVDRRSDIYSAGIVLYELLTGDVPFTGESFVGILTKHATDAVVTPSEARPDLDIPSHLDRLVLRTLEKDPAKRFPSAEALAEALLLTPGNTLPADVRVRTYLAEADAPASVGAPSSTRGLRLAVAALCFAVAALLLALAVALFGQDESREVPPPAPQSPAPTESPVAVQAAVVDADEPVQTPDDDPVDVAVPPVAPEEPAAQPDGLDPPAAASSPERPKKSRRPQNDRSPTADSRQKIAEIYRAEIQRQGSEWFAMCRKHGLKPNERLRVSVRARDAKLLALGPADEGQYVLPEALGCAKKSIGAMQLPTFSGQAAVAFIVELK